MLCYVMLCYVKALFHCRVCNYPKLKLLNYCETKCDKENQKGNYSADCVIGTAVGVKMCDDKALGGASGNEL